MIKTKYFIRLNPALETSLTEYLREQHIEHSHISSDMVRGVSSVIYSVQMDKEEATTIRLKFPVIGFLSFDKIFRKPVEQQVGLMYNTESTGNLDDY